jgi:quinol monooxygenase YgiN
VVALFDAADKAVEAGEPDMLLHTFDRNPNDELGFVWTEVFENSSALEFHLLNPALVKYLSDVNPLLDSFTIELY